MKYIFTTIDIRAIVKELKSSIIGLRVSQIYDVDHKTYLIRLQKPDSKVMLLIESAARIHTTGYEWPKSPAPSSFTMKLRKHLRNKRIESIQQLGVDRVVDLTFGSGDAEYHLIIELYDRGNIALTDNKYLILNVLRPRIDKEITKIIVNEIYHVESARQPRQVPELEIIKTILSETKHGVPLKKILNPLIDCGGSVLEHELINSGLPQAAKFGKDVEINRDLMKIYEAVAKAQSSIAELDSSVDSKGYIIKKKEEKVTADGKMEPIYMYQEFQYKIFAQHMHLPYEEFNSFNIACDEFFSKLESIQLDKKTLQKEKEALKKLDNVRKDHQQRLKQLTESQEVDKRRGQLIELNENLVKNAITVVRSAIANQLDWNHIRELIDEAQAQDDITALAIKNLQLSKNTMTLWLSDPYNCDEDDMLLDSDEEREEGAESQSMRPMAVDIDLDLSSFANARNYYKKKKQSEKKQQKTFDASHKAIKSAEKKTQKTLREVNTIATINKARKVHWFEKFYWFISSENYLVIGGRDGQQNELIVKRHLRPTDVYVHADLHGASSVIIKNSSAGPIPPVTLNEAGTMAICYSKAWDEKVVTSAWWVWGNQVSKTAPTGEYLTTGAFMVRGKKNFLPPSHLVYGFGFVFRLEESSIARHRDERKPRLQEETVASQSFDNSINSEDEIAISETDSLEDINEEEIETQTKQNIPQIDTSRRGVNEESDEDDTVETGSKIEFPDTELEVHHLKEGQFILTALQPGQKETMNNKTESNMKKSQSNASINKFKNKVKENDNEESQQEEVRKKEEHNSPPKRRQKGKLKKMLKYKDQDDEEKELKMKILQSAGVQKPLKGKAAKKAVEAERKAAAAIQREKREREKSAPVAKPVIADDDDVEPEEIAQAVDDLVIIDSLTGIPVADDEILYAVPICAPYSVMGNYKYKLKMIPGTGKKGKACKTAVHLFMSDKSSSSRDKDLLKAVKDYDLARNLPGKVKVSAPNIHKIKKKPPQN